MSECVHPLLLQKCIKLDQKYFINPLVPMKHLPRTRKEYEEFLAQDVKFPYVGVKTDMNGKPGELVYVQKIEGIPIITKLLRGNNGH